jgi:hypothetical protein
MWLLSSIRRRQIRHPDRSWLEDGVIELRHYQTGTSQAVFSANEELHKGLKKLYASIPRMLRSFSGLQQTAMSYSARSKIVFLISAHHEGQ